MELLAPAGNFEILKQAIHAGADSVYFGGETLNARRNADNFSDEEVIRGIDFCHLYGAKSYITLNTIVFEDELDTAAKFLETLAREGADALIVQDFGVLRLARTICPDLPIHASTQMSAHNISDWKVLAELGVKRAVLPRELSMKEIKKMIDQSAIEAEIFVHGALCMSVSGQCYFSSALGERSGNRGLCAQVCRLPFYVREQGRHNLSLKDLSLIDEVPTLEQMGISALKIEGRMKNAAYVASTVKAVRSVLNGETYDRRKLEQIFSRDGFTKGYFTASLGDNMFGTRQEQSSELPFISINTEEEKKIPVYMKYMARSGKPFLVTVKDCDGNTVCLHGMHCEAARSNPITTDMIETHLGKLGGTPYVSEKIKGEIEPNVFLPLSAINQLRREACTRLNQLRILNNKRTCFKKTILKHTISPGSDFSTEPIRYLHYRTAEQISDRSFQFATLVFLPLEEFKKTDGQLIKRYASKMGVELPRIYFGDEQKSVDQLILLKQKGIQYALCHTIGKIRLAHACGMIPIGGFGLNVSNSLALGGLQQLGIQQCTLSPELNFPKIQMMRHTMPIGIVAYGHFPLMITRNCPVRIETGCGQKKQCMLTDRKGKRFPVFCSNGLCEILNAEPICYSDRHDLLRGMDFIWFLFGPEGKEQCETIIRDFENNKQTDPFTRGTYLRKVL